MTSNKYQNNFSVQKIDKMDIEDLITKLNHNDPIIINAELLIEDHTYADFFGLGLVADLRINHKVKAPIILVSHMPYCFFAKNYKIFRLFMGITGHYFEHLPLDWDNYKPPINLRPIDDDELDDINASILAESGIITEEFHRLKNISIENSKGETDYEIYYNRLIEEVQNVFHNIIDYLQYPIVEEVRSIEQKLLQKLKVSILEKQNRQASNNIIARAEEEICNLLPPEEEREVFEEIWEPKPWKVLFVDDSIELLETAKIYFNERKIECVTANSAQDAYDLLEKDLLHRKINVVICGYRMRDLENPKIWQDKQGYTILKDIYYKHKNYVSLFALSSANKRSLLRILKRHESKVFVYSKDDVMGSEGGFNLFTEKVIEEGDRIVNAFARLPKAKVWIEGNKEKIRPNYLHYYRLHRLATDYEIADYDLNMRAERYIDFIRNKKNGNSGTQPETFDFHEGINEDLGYKESLRRFRTKLIGRRICIGLFNLLELEKRIVYSALKTGRLADPKELDGSANSLFSVFLGFRLGNKNYINENQLLPEESAWYNQLKTDFFE